MKAVLALVALLGVCIPCAFAQLSGPLSGTLPAGVHQVVGDISVGASDTLIIEPGAILRFEGPYGFTVSGRLHAVGTASDSIRFEPEAGGSWNALRFLALPPDYLCDMSRLDYCVVTGSSSSGIVFIGSPSVSHSAIRGNEGTNGGGLSVLKAPTLDQCVIEHNTASGKGGGIGVNNYTNEQPIFSGCVIRHNSSGAGGGGVWLEQGSYSLLGPEFTDCEITDNTAGSGGGGLFLDGSTARLTRCIIARNECGIYGEALYRDCTGTTSQPMTLDHCIVSHHSGATALSSDHAELSLAYCTVSDNVVSFALDYFESDRPSEVLGTIVARTGGSGLNANSGAVSVRFCDFYGNTGGNGDIPGHGELTGVNANGDSCDVYMNIFEPPAFVDPVDGDYHLQAGSACIDAGDPASPPDPDQTTADIGALYFSQISAIGETAVRGPAAMVNVFPNPFGPCTTVRFAALPGERVDLAVYNVHGRRVATLAHAPVSAGSHLAVWNGKDDAGRDVPAGTYLVRLLTEGRVQTRKVALVR